MERFVVLLCIILVQVLSKHYTLQHTTDRKGRLNEMSSWGEAESTETNRNSDDTETVTSTTTPAATPTTTSTTTPISTPSTTFTTTPSTTSTTTPTTMPTITTEELNLCNLPEVPKFSPETKKSGQRISEIKCLEYISEVEQKKLEMERSYECQERLLQKINRDYVPKLIPLFIIGGQAALIREIPHMAAIGWKASVGTWVFKCGGSLISRNFVLTAAHCYQASNRDTTIAEVDPKIVRLGHSNIDDITSFQDDAADAIIVRFIRHPKYNPPKKYFDIALIELEKDVVFTKYVQPACLNTGPDDALVGKTASLAGWGVVETVGRTTSPLLQTAIVNVVDSQKCDKLLRPSCNRNWCGINETQLCAGVSSGGIDACQGDSGGPLQIRIFTIHRWTYSVIGVTSFGVNCALPDLPGVYTRVSSFVDWIEEIVWKQ